MTHVPTIWQWRRQAVKGDGHRAERVLLEWPSMDSSGLRHRVPRADRIAGVTVLEDSRLLLERWVERDRGPPWWPERSFTT